MRKAKKFLGLFLMFIVLLPILPFWLLRWAGDTLASLMDWCAEGRAWCQPFVKACEWIEKKMVDDYEAEYAAWKRRNGGA